MAKLQVEVPSLKLNDGISIPMLGYGTGTAASKNEEGKIDRELVETIKTAIKIGYRHLDGAESYMNEPELGLAIKESKIPREQFFVTTKAMDGISNLTAALDASLKKLQLSYVDLYLIHKPFFAENDQDLQEKWAEMESLKAAGKTKSIGVSNYLESHLEATLKTAKEVPSMNQTEFHPYLQREGLLPYMNSKGIAMAAYGPQIPVTKGRPGPLDDVLSSLAHKHGVNEGEICLRWCIDQGVVAITTSAKEQRMSDYMRICAFKLTPKEVDDLSKRGLEKHFRGFWKMKFGENDRR